MNAAAGETFPVGFTSRPSSVQPNPAATLINRDDFAVLLSAQAAYPEHPASSIPCTLVAAAKSPSSVWCSRIPLPAAGLVGTHRSEASQILVGSAAKRVAFLARNVDTDVPPPIAANQLVVPPSDSPQLVLMRMLLPCPHVPPRHDVPMRPGFLLALTVLLAFSTSFADAIAADPDSTAEPIIQPVAADEFEQTIRPILVESCADCHDPDDESNVVGFLRCETASDIHQQRGLWSSVAEQLHNRTMPPADEPQPSEQNRLKVSSWIESFLESTACSTGDFSGNPVPRRLNRDQYTNAIEDLTGVRFDFVETFPGDGGGGEGFDNNGETLFLPPMLMERYLEAAQRIVDHVIVTEPLDKTYVAQPLNADVPGESVAFAEAALSQPGDDSSPATTVAPGTAASLLLPIHTDADYRLVVQTRLVAAQENPVATQESPVATQESPVATQEKPAENSQADVERAPANEATRRLVLRIDGIEVDRFEVPTRPDAEPIRTEIHFARGPHQIELRVARGSLPVAIESLRLQQREGDADQHRKRLAASERLFAPVADLMDDSARSEQAAREVARKTLAEFSRLAWRREITPDEVRALMQLYERGALRGESMRQALKLPLKAVLVSPKFLFVVERTPEKPGMHRISDTELATRLSFFLWHSLPDDELLKLAQTNQLHQPKVLRQQVERMIADERSYRFAEAFAGQWLGTVAVGKTVIPDTNFFKPAYSSELVTDLRRQAGETMHWMLRHDRPVSEWIDADYVVVNERLAKRYRIGSVPESDDFVKVDLSDAKRDTNRAGVLGLGAVHMLTSYSRRTSPVLRGGWVLETIFGTRIPAPPADIPALPGGEKEIEAKTVRDRLEHHRRNPTCAACHDLIDPIGFALENFDVLGRWRDKEGKNEIDAAGQFPSGETFNGPAQLRTALLGRRDEFTHELCKRMLGYALARSLEDADGCTVSRLTQRLSESEGGMQELVLAIVESVPFQNRTGVPDEPPH